MPEVYLPGEYLNILTPVELDTYEAILRNVADQSETEEQQEASQERTQQ